jgi:serine/threonine-protein kinase
VDARRPYNGVSKDRRSAAVVNGAKVKLRARQRLGKYTIRRRLAEGGFADVYAAYDTVEGIDVALKIPHAHLVSDEALEDFRKEVRLLARLDHPNVQPIKTAGYIDDRFVIVQPLGLESLAERMTGRRLPLRRALTLAEQMLEALAHAHEQRIVHCDVKPANFIVFPSGRLRLTDFGIARFAQRTLSASGSGTVGYLAPEQAMGRPSLRSDVFAAGLVLHQMWTGHLPRWPFDWPTEGIKRQRGRLHSGLVELLHKALQVDERKRWADAGQMLAALRRAKPAALRHAAGIKRRRTRRVQTPDWRSVRFREFKRRYGRLLEVAWECPRCGGPFGERMQACPWCGSDCPVYEGPSRFPYRCRRCGRGVKSDWRYCAWCFGPGHQPEGVRRYPDRRYQGRCRNRRCPRGELMPFMRYCPWCRTKVRRRWRIQGATERCGGCGWDVLEQYWSYCPWCGKRLGT